MKRTLVTGVAGFLGSHLQDALLAEQGYDVFGIDNLSGGYARNINPKTHFYNIDIVETEEVKKTIEAIQPEIVFHLAADATEGRSQFTPINCVKNNLLGFINILTTSINNNMKRFVLTSSMSVYGNQKPPFNEQMRRNPVDIYGQNKTAMERILEIMADVHGFKYVIVRPHNCYGERQNMADPYRNVVGIFINKCLKGEQFYIYGDGEQQRSFTYIDNFTPYFVKTAWQNNVVGEIINIGPTEAFTINDLGAAICEEFDIPFDPIYLPDRPTEVKYAYSTKDKAEKFLGYETTVSFKEGIKRMIEWAKTLGPQKFQYLEDLEIVSDVSPLTWRKELI